MKLPKGVFEPLLKPVRNSRPVLYKTLLSQSLISGEQAVDFVQKEEAWDDHGAQEQAEEGQEPQ